MNTKEYEKVLLWIPELIPYKPKITIGMKEESVLLRIYRDILEGIQYSKRIMHKCKVNTIHKDMTYPSKSVFIPDEIINVIHTSMHSQTIYTCSLLGRTILIHVGVLNPIAKKDMDERIRLMYSWLYVCHKYSKYECTRTLNIYIYFTEHKKLFPTDNTILHASHANTAYTYACAIHNTMVIYRSEEWFKVFIHECLHAYGFEPSDRNEIRLSQSLSERISIPCKVRVSETYVETWARIINVCYKAILNSKDFKSFLRLTTFYLNVESIFSVLQASRILKYMKLSYHDVLQVQYPVTRLNYKENTHIFAYYILTSVLMHKPLKLLVWCNNPNWLEFNNDVYRVATFESLLMNALYDESYQSFIQHCHTNIPWNDIGMCHTIIKTI
jgi:hypothetical protein